MITHLLIYEALAVLVYMTIWFAVARTKRRIDVVDTAWGGSFIIIGWLAYLERPIFTTFLVALLVTLWGGRLIKHTWRRHLKHNQDDPRYTKMTSGWKNAYWLRVFGAVFVFQGVLALIIALPLTMNIQIPTQQANTPWQTILGACIWIAGFVIESVADRQLRDFLAESKNHGHVMSAGLWRYSRHPNYFGELTQWWGLGVVALAAPFGWIGLIGPLLLSILIIFISGIPTVERGKDKDPEYREYQRRTSPLIPLPPRN